MIPKDSPEPGRYILTSAHFAQARKRLHDRRDALIERRRKELSEFETEFASELAKLDEFERAVAAMAAQPLAERQSSKRRKTRNESKPKPAATSSSNRRYTAEEDAEILATADTNALRELAAGWRRSFQAVEKHRENLLKRRAPHLPAQADASSSKSPEIVEPTPAPPAASIFDGYRAMERKPPERGTPVRGVVENGPEDRREYGRGFESSGRQ